MILSEAATMSIVKDCEKKLYSVFSYFIHISQKKINFSFKDYLCFSNGII